ncbi:MAG: hypothetical protein P0Y65_06075 [Candidatus Devosia phytovorans]|uniref:Uncharacterized protein n=1 Tax=Candidatus Devosia phytovorans TaxID=3121372 RepID=A0AAJ5VXP6_9HYPH|nr:hypothetical protein [Devosia sp.]WEK05820.1 MAG: hypothetical protein P0Y65_06075 [Devosia sp.]
MPSNYASTPTWQRLRIAAMWLFLAPLILFLGMADVLSNGRTRNWPLGEVPREDEPG